MNIFLFLNLTDVIIKNETHFQKRGAEVMLGKSGFVVVSFMILILLAGCSGEITSEVPAEESDTVHNQDRDVDEEAKKIIDLCFDLFEKAVEEDRAGDVEMIRSIVKCLGENGYTAVDRQNQINMTEAEAAEEFCESVNGKEKAEITIIEVNYLGGFIKYDLQTQEGNVDVVRSYYKYENGSMDRKAKGNYRAENWTYTEEGYITFSGVWFPEEFHAFTTNGAEEQTVFRVQPLEEVYRELNRKYIQPIGYAENNLFLVNWSEENFGELDFYDVYDVLYPQVKGQPVPYEMDENLGVGAVYWISKEEFENVIRTHFNVDDETLQSKTTFYPEDAAYEYKPRGFYEVEYPEYPYPEVVGFTENGDGTITLTVNVVYPYKCDSKVYAHEVVIRLLDNEGFQYVSNQILSSEDNGEASWHNPRLTEEEWEERYGEK